MTSLGLVGAGVMGKGMALHFTEKGYEVHAYDKDTNALSSLVKEYTALKAQNESIALLKEHYELKDLVSALSSPVLIVLMIPSGSAVDEVLEELNSLLSERDIVVDAGNSYYLDTERRIERYKFKMAGCGVSGGEYGGRHGASITFGCVRELYDEVKEVFENAAAKYGDVPCCGWFGTGGAGHLVKAVHNGIEYCEMQLIQEIYYIIKNQNKNENSYDKADEVLSSWKEKDVGGFLVSLCSQVLESKEDGNRYTLERIEDLAEQKGTGKMCVEVALKTESANTAIAEAVMARFISLEKERRINFAKIKADIKGTGSIKVDKMDLERAFRLSKAVSFIQGFDLILKVGGEKNWDVSITTLCRVWRRGCILESKFLETCEEISKTQPFEESPVFVEIYKNSIKSLRNVVTYAVQNGLPAPLFATCLTWLDSMGTGSENDLLVQAMRDAFGRHGVTFKDGTFHPASWDGDPSL